MHTNHRNNHRNNHRTDSRQRTAFNHAAKSENRVNRARIRQVIRKIEAGCIDPDAAVLPLGK